MITLFSVLLIIANASFNAVKLLRKDIIISTVKQGDLDITVESYGKLISEKLQLITTINSATVQEIVLKPGAIVTEESVIVKLANPDLQQHVESAQQELEQFKANLRQLIVTHQREILDEDAKFAELEAIYETAKLRKNAEEKLVNDGIVSDLTFKESVLNEKQLSKRIVIFNKRAAQLQLVHKEAVNIQQERINQQQGTLKIVQKRLDKLVVRAGFNGVLQRLSVSLGQSLSAGQEVALIGSVSKLIALIRVPQNQAQQVLIGQKVEVDTRQNKIIGTVIRIDPIVANNSVEVEVALPSNLPKSARPQQNIDARIFVKTLQNVIYIERPVSISAYANIELYKLNSTSTLANRASLKLGNKAGRYIEIEKGGRVGERFIISDLNNYSIDQIIIE